MIDRLFDDPCDKPDTVFKPTTQEGSMETSYRITTEQNRRTSPRGTLALWNFTITLQPTGLILHTSTDLPTQAEAFHLANKWIHANPITDQ